MTPPARDREHLRVLHADPYHATRWEGAQDGASISVIVSRNDPGPVTSMHRHPYDETWVVQAGRITFYAGGDSVQVGPGDIVNVPADTPHKFTNDGPGRCHLLCIHPSPTIIEERVPE